jgi:hypothetical protein
MEKDTSSLAVKLPKRLTMPEAFNNGVWRVGAATPAFLALFFDVFVRGLAVMNASDRWGRRAATVSTCSKKNKGIEAGM